MATKTKKDSFGIDADPEEFDIEEWLSGASLPTRSVKIYRDGVARSQLDELADEFEALGRKVSEEHETAASDRSLGDGGPLAKQYEVAQKMDAIIKATEESVVWVRVRALTSDEMLKIQAKKLTDLKLYPEILSVAGRIVANDREAPAMSAAKWTAFQNKIGQKQFKKIVAAVDDSSGFGGSEQVMPDFSPDVSALLSTKGS